MRATLKNVPSIYRYGFGVRLHIESLRPPMLLLSLKAGPIYGAIEDGRTMCGGVRYRSVSLDRHACATLLSLVWGADSPPPKTEQHCLVLLTNWDACASSKLLSRVLWVQQHYTSRLTVREAYCWVLVPCMGTTAVSDGFPPCCGNFLFSGR